MFVVYLVLLKRVCFSSIFAGVGGCHGNGSAYHHENDSTSSLLLNGKLYMYSVGTVDSCRSDRPRAHQCMPNHHWLSEAYQCQQCVHTCSIAPPDIRRATIAKPERDKQETDDRH